MHYSIQPSKTGTHVWMHLINKFYIYCIYVNQEYDWKRSFNEIQAPQRQLVIQIFSF